MDPDCVMQSMVCKSRTVCLIHQVQCVVVADSWILLIVVRWP